MINLAELLKAIKPFVVGWAHPWVHLQAPITSSDWDGDARSTTSKTLIDVSAVFVGVPAGVKAVEVKIGLRDSGSAGSASGCYLILSPENGSASGGGDSCAGLANDALRRTGMLTIPCNSDGDIYYEINASGAGTMDVWLEVWGYCL